MQNIVIKNKKTVKFLSILLCVVLVFASNLTVTAATLTVSGFEKKLEEVKKMYPDGSQKVDWSVNGSYVGSQCHGYARWLSSYVWGTDFANGSGKGWERYDSTATTTAIDKLVPGDVLRYRTSASKTSNHSIFVTAIDGETVYFTDCNSDGKSTIKWNRSTTKSYLAEHLKMMRADIAEYGYIAHYTANTLSASAKINVIYNANGGELNLPTQKVTQYTITSSNGVNMRSGAGTEFSKVGTMPKGAVFTITESKTDSKGEYLWGKTTYNGVNGWCVISASWVTKTETETPPDYYLNSDGNIYITKTKKPVEDSFMCGSTYSNGLFDPSTVKLERKDYTFLGWSTTPNGEVYYKSTDTVVPETIFPEYAEEGGTVTLYAVWQSTFILNSIEVEALPAKTKYLLNAPFDSSGLKIKLNYINNTPKSITEGFELTGFDSSTAGEKTITATYEDKTVTFTVLVEDLKTGDLNDDLNINLSDITLLSQYVAGWEVQCKETALDVNGDEAVNLVDLVHLARYVAGWEGVEIK